MSSLHSVSILKSWMKVQLLGPSPESEQAAEEFWNCELEFLAEDIDQREGSSNNLK